MPVEDDFLLVTPGVRRVGPASQGRKRSPETLKRRSVSLRMFIQPSCPSLRKPFLDLFKGIELLTVIGKR